MRWWDRIRAAAAALRGKVKGDGYDFTRWFSPQNIFAQKASHTLATNETIFAAITRLSNSMASMPLKLRRRFEPVDGQIADLMANAPNRNMTSFDFHRLLEVHRDTNGNGYGLKMYDSNFQVESIHILDPTRVTPVLEEPTRELWYEIQGDDGTYYVHNMDMIHVRHIYGGTGYQGISPIDVLRNTVEFDAQVRKFTLDTLDGAIKASFILKMQANLSEDKQKQALDAFRRFYRENGGVLIEQAGTEIKTIEREFMDTKVFEVERITRGRVATVFNLPVHMLGETQGLNYASMEQTALEFVQFTMVPIVRHYEQEYNRKLLTPEQRRQGYEFKFNLNALLRGDIRTRGDFYFRGIRTGFFKPNEVRAWEELPPEEGGDVLYISKDLVPIGEARKGVSR